MQSKKTLLFGISVLFLLGCIVSSGCVAEDSSVQLPEITQMTEYEDFNLYLADLTECDYKLDELLNEHITDVNMLKKTYGRTCSTGL